MPDNEKIIAKLQDAAAYFRSGFDAMYGTVACEKYRNWTDAIEQAIALLKAQELMVMAGAELTDAELIEKIRKAPITLKPAVDAVPVVRCAYCKHCFDMGSDPMEPYDGESEWYCERFDRDTSAYEIDPYRFFCADGERRNDDAADAR